MATQSMESGVRCPLGLGGGLVEYIYLGMVRLVNYEKGVFYISQDGKYDEDWMFWFACLS